MSTNRLIRTLLLALGAIYAVAVVGNQTVYAQSGPSTSISYDLLPYQDFSDPIVQDDDTEIADARVRLSKVRASLSFPVVLSGGRTVLINDFSYQLVEFEYENWDFALKTMHSASYTLMVQQRLGQKWSVWAVGTPSLASDLRAEVTENDFNIETAVVFIRHFSERLSLGAGAAYTTQFGSGEFVPLLGLDWNNGRNLMIRAIIPDALEFWYRPDPRMYLGLLVSGDGNSYRGDPERYLVADPELRYTMLTVGPVMRISLSKLVQLQVEAGVIALHRFEFYDGDREAGSYDLEPSHYVRLGLRFGGQ